MILPQISQNILYFCPLGLTPLHQSWNSTADHVDLQGGGQLRCDLDKDLQSEYFKCESIRITEECVKHDKSIHLPPPAKRKNPEYYILGLHLFKIYCVKLINACLQVKTKYSLYNFPHPGISF